MTALLKAYFPQVLQWVDDIRTTLVCDFLPRWPTLEAVQKVRPATLEKFFREHNSVRKETLAHRIAAIKAAVPLTTDPAVLHASVLMIKALATQMQTTIEAIRAFDSEIEQLCSRHEDYPLFASLPGAGPVYAARLTAALGTDQKQMDYGGRITVLLRCGARAGTQGEVVLDSMALLLSEVSATVMP